MKVLVTGANGFIGQNLIEKFSNLENIEVYTFDRDNTMEELEEYIVKSDFIFHFIGVMRPVNISEFDIGNVQIIEKIIKIIEKNKLKIPILFTSSIQVIQDNEYGKTKLKAEKLLRDYSQKNEVPVFIYRMTNTFGKYARPNYSSVIATWCYNIVNGLDIFISNKETVLNLVYIDDVISTFLEHLFIQKEEKENYEIKPIYTKNLGEIAKLLYSFRDLKKESNIEDEFEKKLYLTYLSYLNKRG